MGRSIPKEVEIALKQRFECEAAERSRIIVEREKVRRLKLIESEQAKQASLDEIEKRRIKFEEESRLANQEKMVAWQKAKDIEFKTKKREERKLIEDILRRREEKKHEEEERRKLWANQRQLRLDKATTPTVSASSSIAESPALSSAFGSARRKVVTTTHVHHHHYIGMPNLSAAEKQSIEIRAEQKVSTAPAIPERYRMYGNKFLTPRESHVHYHEN